MFELAIYLCAALLVIGVPVMLTAALQIVILMMESTQNGGERQ